MLETQRQPFTSLSPGQLIFGRRLEKGPAKSKYESNISWAWRLGLLLQVESKPQTEIQALRANNEYQSLLTEITKESLGPLEKVAFIGVLHRSGKDSQKFKFAWEILRSADQVSLAIAEPEIDEKMYNHQLNDAGTISMVKAYEYFPSSVGSEDRSRAIYAYLEKVQKVENVYGLHLAIVASDVTGIEYDEEGEQTKVFHKPPEQVTGSKETFYEYLRTQHGSARTELTWVLHRGYKVGLSIYEPLSDVGVTMDRSLLLTQLSPSDDFLRALVFGLHDPTQPVNLETASQFRKIQAKYLADNDRTRWLFGWTPERGMPLEIMTRVNSGWKDDCAFISELLTRELKIDGQVITKDDPAFDEALDTFREIVTGYPHHLNRLLRFLLKVSQAQQLIHAHTVSPEMISPEELLSCQDFLSKAQPPVWQEKWKTHQQITTRIASENELPSTLLQGDWYRLEEDAKVFFDPWYLSTLVKCLAQDF